MCFTIERPMPPIWIMYPHISLYSIGWRMGYGETYKYDLAEWKDTLSTEEKKKYDELFPSPVFWRNIYDDDFNENDFDKYNYELITFWEEQGKPKYSISSLANETNALEFLCFWKPNHQIVDESCLSQLQYSEFVVDIHDFISAEQYIMVEKARLFEDEEIEQQILDTKDPTEVTSLGQKVKNFKQDIWDRVKYSIVLTANYYKFTQNKALREFLLSTENKILVEANPLDKIWGVGLSSESSNIHLPSSWKGENLLGFALMEVRDEIKRIYKHYDKINWSKINEKYN